MGTPSARLGFPSPSFASSAPARASPACAGSRSRTRSTTSTNCGPKHSTRRAVGASVTGAGGLHHLKGESVAVRPAARVPTGDQILAAARTILHRDGVAQLSTRGVAAEAGVNLSLIHYYFRSREGLLLALLERMDADLVARQRSMYARQDMTLAEKWAEAIAFYRDDLFPAHLVDHPLPLLEGAGAVFRAPLPGCDLRRPGQRSLGSTRRDRGLCGRGIRGGLPRRDERHGDRAGDPCGAVGRREVG